MKLIGTIDDGKRELVDEKKLKKIVSGREVIVLFGFVNFLIETSYL